MPQTTPSIRLHDVQPDELHLHDVLIGLFLESFGHYERYAFQIRHSLILGQALNTRVLPHHFLIEVDGEFVGFMLLNYLVRHNFGFGRYIGVHPAYQNQGIGADMHDLARQQIEADAVAYGREPPIGFCTETDPPETAPDERERALRQRRIDFFLRKCGGIQLDVDYFEPPMISSLTPHYPIDLSDARPQPMYFFLFPTDLELRIDAAETRRLVEGVLVDHYQLSPDSEFVHTVVQSIRPTLLSQEKTP